MQPSAFLRPRHADVRRAPRPGGSRARARVTCVAICAVFLGAMTGPPTETARAGTRSMSEVPHASNVPRAPDAPRAPEDRASQVIVIDPGHGGPDPGALGRGGTREKDVTLSVARILRRKLEEAGYAVVLTRNEDRYVSLQDRSTMTTETGASVFISLHADWVRDPGASGVSVHTLQPEASADDAARVVGRRGEIDRLVGSEVEDGNLELLVIALDLLRRKARRESIRLAELLVAEIGAEVSVAPHPHRRSDLAVLRSYLAPSVLLELGFLSSPADEALLRRVPYQERIADAVRRAVDRYLDAASAPAER